MTAAALAQRVPFVTALRSRAGVVSVGSGAGPRLTVRVELPEQWDTIAFAVSASMLVVDFKRAALAAFGLPMALPADFIVKLRGFEVHGDAISIAESGARDGSTFLLTHRRRRPVR